MEDAVYGSVWVFAYGSLIWRPDFSWHTARLATVGGWARRFWQGSHDHRGTPSSPGRVVTLVRRPGAQCVGLAYLLEQKSFASIFRTLDRREQNGYGRLDLRLVFEDGDTAQGTAYIALPDNPAWLGDAPLEELATQIATRTGPSGSNRHYLMKLQSALHELGIDDEHVEALAARVHAL